MYIWIGCGLPAEFEREIRARCERECGDLALDAVAFTLPQHISLKISFDAGEEYEAVLDALEDILHREEKFYVNLKAVNAYALTRRGVKSIDISTDCTLCQTDRFWSARKHRDERGSQGAIIVCKGGIGK